MDKSWGSFWQDASDDFKACWAAGVENGRTTVYVRSGE